MRKEANVMVQCRFYLVLQAVGLDIGICFIRHPLKLLLLLQQLRMQHILQQPRPLRGIFLVEAQPRTLRLGLCARLVYTSLPLSYAVLLLYFATAV